MSELFVLTGTDLLAGFQLAGVRTIAVEDAAEAEEFILERLRTGEGGLAAIDENILAEIRPEVLHRMRRSDDLFHVAIPGQDPDDTEFDREQRLADMIRRAIGFHVSFEAGEEPVES